MKKQKGITLIALVITIIVLLILAGISIATLTGENGILSQATRAGEETKKADVIERAQTDILGKQAENKSGDITIGQLEEVLNKYFEDVPEEDELQEKLEEEDFKLKSKPEYGGQQIEISDIYDGSLTDSPPATATEVNALIGQTVDYKENSGKVTSWRVFYASDTEMFLISSNTIASKTAFGPDSNGIPLKQKGTNRDYIGATDDVFKTGYGAKYNEKWLATKTSDTYTRSKATAYLCDPENWKEYVGDNAPEGTYAVGGPTKELLSLSWNQAVENGGENAPEAKVEWHDSDVVAGGYLYNKPDALFVSNPIQSTILVGLYNTGEVYWLASTGSYNDSSVCVVDSRRVCELRQLQP